jgi:hypothetical protein
MLDVRATIHAVVYKYPRISVDPPRRFGGYRIQRGYPRPTGRNECYAIVAKYSAPGDERKLVLKYGSKKPGIPLRAQLWVIRGNYDPATGRENYDPDLAAYDAPAIVLGRTLGASPLVHEVEVAFDCGPAPGSRPDQRLLERLVIENGSRKIGFTKNGTLHLGERKSSLRVRIYNQRERRPWATRTTRIEFIFRYKGFRHQLRSLEDFLRQGDIEKRLLGKIRVRFTPVTDDANLPPNIANAVKNGGLQAVYSGGVGKGRMYASVTEKNRARRTYVHSSTILSKLFENEIQLLVNRWLSSNAKSLPTPTTAKRPVKTPVRTLIEQEARDALCDQSL